MNYYDMLLDKVMDKTAIVEDGVAYKYSELIAMADMECDRRGFRTDGVYIIREKTIMRQLTAFLACNKYGCIPMIVPYDTKILPEDTEVPEDVCMAVMTSGTTGVPKILYRTYESWAGYFPIQNRVFGIDSDSVLFVQGSLAFTGNMNLYLAQLYAGGTIVAQNDFNPKRWEKVMDEWNVNAVYLIPSKLMLLPEIFKHQHPSVRTILSGSQSLGKTDAYILKRVFNSAKIILYYGASELNYISYVTDEEMTSERNLIGRSFPEVSVFVQDGEIYVDTPYHVYGVKCPFSLKDKGYMDDEGNLYFSGRPSDMMNIRGRKVSAVRIENALESLSDICEAAVMLVEQESNDKIMENKKILTAFVTLADDASSWSVERVMSKLRVELAHYEMPRKIIVVDKFPQNESGKIDKNILKRKYVNGGIR